MGLVFFAPGILGSLILTMPVFFWFLARVGSAFKEVRHKQLAAPPLLSVCFPPTVKRQNRVLYYYLVQPCILNEW